MLDFDDESSMIDFDDFGACCCKMINFEADASNFDDFGEDA